MTARRTRRGFLATAGAVVLAGCNGNQLGEEETTLSSYRLHQVVEDGETDPVVVPTLPVDLEQAYLDDATARTTDLLARLPLPLTAEAIPNGHVRQHLATAASDATDALDEARTAASQWSALQSLRHARSNARYAAAGWAFTQDETDSESLRAERDAVDEDARALQSDHEHLGTDPVHAALVHAPIEESLDRVLEHRRPPRDHGGPGSLLTVAQRAEHAETARARVDDARHLYDQFTASLPDDVGTVDERLTAASDAIAAELSNRQSALPPTPTEYGPAGHRLYRLRDATTDGPDRISEAEGPADALLTATSLLTDALAYDDVHDRRTEDRAFRVADVAAFESVRSTAVEAVATALEESERPALARHVLADVARTITHHDQRVTRYQSAVQPSRLDEQVAGYTIATARAQNVRTACQRTLDELEL